MFIAIYVLYAILSLLALVTMLMAFYKHSESHMSIAVWSDILAMLILYQLAGGEILGLFFGYANALLYTLNLAILVIAISYFLLNSTLLQRKDSFNYLAWGISVIMILGGLLLLTNVWINAHFIEHKKAGKPILQVATLGNNPHCAYRYLFYKVRPDGKVAFLCPNHYGLIPRSATLQTTPAFLANQFQQNGNDD